jgi:predicted Rossmann fold nucleotide-binding protein DprA/Smf involved in DNA uptake
MDAALYSRLIELVGDPPAFSSVPSQRFESVQGVSPALARLLSDGGDIEAWRDKVRSLSAAGIGVLLLRSPGYPRRLAESGARFPLVFFTGCGDTLERERTIGFFSGASVGPAPLELALWLGAELARNGVAAVGMLGNPAAAAAHGGALENRGWALGVAPHGLGVKPRGPSREHASAIAQRGAVCTVAMPDEKAGTTGEREALSFAVALCDGIVLLDESRLHLPVNLQQEAARAGRPVFTARFHEDDGFLSLVEEGAIPLPPRPGFSVDLLLRELGRPRRKARAGQLDLFGQ